MKKIEAIVRPFQLDALAGLGVSGMTVSEVRGFGRQGGHAEFYRGAEYAHSFQPKAKVEVVVRDRLTQEVMNVLRDAAYTGRVGDGKIFVLGVEEAVRIRTGDRGDFAVS